MSTPRLPDAPGSYDAGYMSRLLASLRAYFVQLEAVRHINIASCNIALDTLPTTDTGARDGDVWVDGNVLKVAGLVGGGGSYQPLDADLTAIAALTGTAGFLKTNGAGTWSVDAATYSVSSHTHAFADITSKPTTIGGYGITDFNSLGDARWSLTGHNHSGVYQPLDTDLTNIAALTGSSGFLKTNGSGTWSVDTATYSVSGHNHSGVYQPVDADLTAIAALAGTSGFLKKTATDTWTLDTNSYSLTSHTHAFADITSKPTTIGGYGITDFNSLGDARWSLTGHNHSGTYYPVSGGTVSGNVDTTGYVSSGNGAAGEKTIRLHNDSKLVYFYLQASGGEVGLWDSTGSLKRFYSDVSQNFVALGNVTAYSDERLKSEFYDANVTLDQMLGLKPEGFLRIDTGQWQVGVRAQALQKVLPEAIVTDAQGYLSVNYGSAAMVLILNLAREVAELKRQLNGKERHSN